MPDLDDYRRAYPGKTDEELQKLQWAMRGLARVVVKRFRDLKRDEKAAQGVACPPK